MPIIIKPISANLTKDADGFGKAVLHPLSLGPLLRSLYRARKTKDYGMQGIRKISAMD